METTKDSIRQYGLVLVPTPLPLPHLVPPTFLSPPLFFSFLPLALNFPSPSFHPSSPPPALFLISYRRRRRPCVWFRAQMALACLWQWIKPPVSPFASMCKWSGQRTSNRRKGGRNARKERKKTHTQKNPSAVKQHSTLMFHGIPGRVNSNACKNRQPAFLFPAFL